MNVDFEWFVKNTPEQEHWISCKFTHDGTMYYGEWKWTTARTIKDYHYKIGWGTITLGDEVVTWFEDGEDMDFTILSELFRSMILSAPNRFFIRSLKTISSMLENPSHSLRSYYQDIRWGPCFHVDEDRINPEAIAGWIPRNVASLGDWTVPIAMTFFTRSGLWTNTEYEYWAREEGGY